jgi:hypothetical protein
MSAPHAPPCPQLQAASGKRCAKSGPEERMARDCVRRERSLLLIPAPSAGVRAVAQVYTQCRAPDGGPAWRCNFWGRGFEEALIIVDAIGTRRLQTGHRPRGVAGWGIRQPIPLPIYSELRHCDAGLLALARMQPHSL